MSARSPVDLVIVGAGVAGLGAARTARQLGIEFVVLEALDRIGGRAFTDPRPFGVPWDRGCHWLHSASLNPFTALADEYGFRYRSRPAPDRLFLDGQWLSDAEQRDAETFIDEAFATILAAGHEGRDVPAATLVDQTSRWFPLFQLDVHAEWGVAVERVSCRDAAAYIDTDENWPVADGYGALVARHAAGIPVTLGTPVERIDWGGPRVRITTSQSTIEAGAVIVTVSTNVLTRELIRFEPPLPPTKLDAAAAVPLGSANKVGLQIDGRHLDVDAHTNVTAPLGDGQLMSFQLRPFGWDLASGYLAGPLCGELERDGEAALIDAAVTALRALLGNDVARHIQSTAASTWGQERTIGGGYAAVRPGQALRRAELAAPLGDRVFFAGEATSRGFFSTCHGAYLSGQAAARAAAATAPRA